MEKNNFQMILLRFELHKCVALSISNSKRANKKSLFWWRSPKLWNTTTVLEEGEGTMYTILKRNDYQIKKRKAQIVKP